MLADGDQFDGDWFDFDIATEAVVLFPHLVAAASDPDAELTVFLPNDDAFRRLVRDLTGSAPATEADTFAAVASLGVDTIRTVLLYHIVAGPPISVGQAKVSDGAVLTTLQGGAIEVDVRGSRNLPRLFLIDQDPDARDPRVIAGDLEGPLANGYAHGSDRVLRPIDL